MSARHWVRMFAAASLLSWSSQVSALVIDNDVPGGDVGHFLVELFAPASDTVVPRARFDLGSGPFSVPGYFATYQGSVDPGNDGGAMLLELSAGNTVVTGDDELTYSGSFTGDQGNTIDWTAVLSIPAFSQTATTVLSFEAATGTLGELRFRRFVDPDAPEDGDRFFSAGSAAGGDLQLLSLNATDGWGWGFGGAYSEPQGLANASFAGWVAGLCPPACSLPAVSPGGLVIGSGVGDPRLAMAWDVDASATQATVVTYFRAVPEPSVGLLCLLGLAALAAGRRSGHPT